jgi:hypothetical protein
MAELSAQQLVLCADLCGFHRRLLDLSTFLSELHLLHKTGSLSKTPPRGRQQTHTPETAAAPPETAQPPPVQCRQQRPASHRTSAQSETSHNKPNPVHVPCVRSLWRSVRPAVPTPGRVAARRRRLLLPSHADGPVPACSPRRAQTICGQAERGRGSAPRAGTVWLAAPVPCAHTRRESPPLARRWRRERWPPASQTIPAMLRAVTGVSAGTGCAHGNVSHTSASLAPSWSCSVSTNDCCCCSVRAQSGAERSCQP